MTEQSPAISFGPSIDPAGIVLFVDDEPAILSALLRVFSPLALVRPLIAPNAEAALQLLERFPVDVIVTDYRMPGISGNDLLGICRRRFPGVSRVLLTAYADRKTVSDAATAGGAELVFVKPWDDEALRNGILKALAEAVRWRRMSRLRTWAGTGRLQDAAADLLEQLEARDPGAAARTWRVAEATRLFADDMGLDAAELYVAALLHDIGKAGGSDPAAGEKPAAQENMNAEEGQEASVNLAAFATQEPAHAHALRAEKVILRLPGGAGLAPWVRHHHERFDGGGSPDGLHGASIPLGARALRVAELSVELAGTYARTAEVLQAIMQLAGTELDPRVAKAFVVKALELAVAGSAAP